MAKMMEVPEWTDKVDVRKRPCERIPVNSPTVKKTMLWSGLKNSRSFFTVYNNYRNLSSFFSRLTAAAQPSLSGYMISSSPSTLPQFLSGIVHFLAISWVDRYKAFKSAVSLGNTLFCLFRRRLYIPLTEPQLHGLKTAPLPAH